MNLSKQEIKQFEILLQRDHRFTVESYRLILEALNLAQRNNSGNEIKKADRNVTGQELSAAVRDYALEQFGYMARVILARLGIRRTGDIGDIVYNLIDINLMSKIPNDRREDFDNVFDRARDLEHGFSFKN